LEILPHAFGFGGKGIRTPDFQLAKLALYQLSYAPRRKLRSVHCEMRICKSPPRAEPIFGFNDYYIVFLEYRHKLLFELFFPKIPLVKFVSHPFATLLIRKGAHPEKCVGIFDREKWSENFHANFLVGRNGFRFKDFKEFGSFPGGNLVGAHFDDHPGSVAPFFAGNKGRGTRVDETMATRLLSSSSDAAGRVSDTLTIGRTIFAG
jgi:hypothetical protein